MFNFDVCSFPFPQMFLILSLSDGVQRTTEEGLFYSNFCKFLDENHSLNTIPPASNRLVGKLPALICQTVKNFSSNKTTSFGTCKLKEKKLTFYKNQVQREAKTLCELPNMCGHLV